MKKLVIKILLLMLIVMGCVVGISQLILYIVRSQGIEISSTISYYVSLGSGFLGLILFFMLLDCLIFKRLKLLSKAVHKISTGQYDVQLKCSGRDELNQLMLDFNNMANKLQANEYLSQEFVKNVSHEFKTPLAVIIGYVDLLKSEDQHLSQQQREYLKTIANQAIRLENLSRQMLLISQLDADVNQSPKSEFSPAKQIQMIILSMQTQWDTKHLEWDLNLAATPINSYAELCYCMWQNLIANAVKFAKHNTTIKLTLTCDEILTFTITNHGPTISLAEQALIFKQFYTNKTQQNTQGSGLGLPLVHKIIHKLNGEIKVHSENDLTTFELWFPLTTKKCFTK